jgi:hypothetical protein
MSYVSQLLPFLELASLYDGVLLSLEKGHLPGTSATYVYSTSNVSNPYMTVISTIVCPSDPNGKTPSGESGRVSYLCCWGDVGVRNPDNDTNYSTYSGMNTRGAFLLGRMLSCSFASVTDGLSNSIFISEGVISDNTGGSGTPVKGGLALQEDGTGISMFNLSDRSVCLATVKSYGLVNALDINGTGNGAGCGRRWGDGMPGCTGFITATYPNGPSCSNAGVGSSGILGVNSANSMHLGGVNTVFGDGAVRFVSETIDCGSSNKLPNFGTSGESPFGVWGALGTIASGENKSL